MSDKCKYLVIKEKPCKRTGKVRKFKHCKFIGMEITRECELCIKKVVE